MIRQIPDNITDEEFSRLVAPTEKKIERYIKDNFIDDYIAFWIATRYKDSTMWTSSLKCQIKAALNDLAQLDSSSCNKEKIFNLLKENYKLKIVNEDPLDILEITKGE